MIGTCPSSLNAGTSRSSDRTQMEHIGAGEAGPATQLRKSTRRLEVEKVGAAATSRKSRRAVATTALSSDSLCQDPLSTFKESEAWCGNPAPSSRFRYNTLVTISIAMLAMAMIQPAYAGLSCETNADCSVKGVGKCKQHSNGEATCVYKSCAAGFWGAGSTYTDCFECPSDMTSLEGKAFYNTDCFIHCGESRCFMPEDGYTECSIEPATAKQICFSTCNRDGFVVANPDRAYATCVPNHQMYLGSHPAQAHGITNQSPPKLIVETAEDENNPKHNLRRERKRPRILRRTTGRRLRKSAELGSGPAVALLEHAGEDPWALVSK